MTGLMAVFDIVIVVVLVALTVAAMLLAREIGRIQVRLGPLGARTMDGGAAVGQPGPSFEELRDQRDESVTIGGARERPQLLLFTSPDCSTCASLMPGVRALAHREREVDVVIVSDGLAEDHERFLRANDLGDEISYVDAFEVGVAYQVGSIPYGVMLDREGAVRGKGLCNHMQHVESLINAAELDLPSVQHLHDRAVAARAGVGR